MLIDFSVDNFRSIKDRITLSMATPPLDPKVSRTGHNNVHRSAVIFGANASGKSAILRAFEFMKRMVLNLDKVILSTDELPYEPFSLSTTTADKSSLFEASFVVDGTTYRYGFDADKCRVYSEWLYMATSGQEEISLFHRDADGQPEIKVNETAFRDGIGLKCLPNTLFLWKCDQEGCAIAKDVMKWFQSVHLMDDTNRSIHGVGSIETLMKDEAIRTQIVGMLKSADLGVSGIQFTSPNARGTNIKLLHKKFDESLQCIGHESFWLDEQESNGVQSFLALSAPMFDAFNHGKTLMVDGLGVHLHPQLTIALVSMFNDPDINTKGAQLIFSTHCSNLLHQSIFQKSQIWFAEKDDYGATRLYSLDQFEGVSNSDDIEKQYLQGQFGAIPCLGRFSQQALGI